MLYDQNNMHWIKGIACLTYYYQILQLEFRFLWTFYMTSVDLMLAHICSLTSNEREGLSLFTRVAHQKVDVMSGLLTKSIIKLQPQSHIWVLNEGINLNRFVISTLHKRTKLGYENYYKPKWLISFERINPSPPIL